MSRKTEQVVEPCNCECDCPGDVLAVEADNEKRQAVALAAATAQANEALKAATERAKSTLDAASKKLDEARQRASTPANGNGHASSGVLERLAPAAALSALGGMVQERREAAAEGMDDARKRAADRIGDVAGSAAEKLDDVRGKTADRVDDIRSKAADTLGGVRSGVRDARKSASMPAFPWQRRKRPASLIDRINAGDTFSRVSDRAGEGLKAAAEGLGSVLPKKRQPTLWERLALASAFGGLFKSFEDLFSGTQKQAKRQAKMLGRAKKTEMRLAKNAGKAVSKKAEKQAKKLRKQVQPKGGVSPLTWGLALGLGAGLMYFFDPETGDRRRALLRDQFVHYRKTAQDRFAGRMEDLNNRAQGLAAEAHRYTAAEDLAEQPADRVLAERVRAQLGFLVSHPGSIDVLARGGIVTLRGPVLAAEVEPLLARVRLIPGVTSVSNRLEIHEEPGNVPGLQGGSTTPSSM